MPKNTKIVKADPRIHLEELKKVENKILKKIQDIERDLKLQLTELRVTRDLMEESFKSLEEIEKEEFEDASEKLKQNINKIEDVIEDFEEQKNNLDIDKSENPYEINAYSLKQTISYDTIERLYDLANKNNWSTQDAQDFVKIRYDVGAALKADFNPIVAKRLDNVYQAIQYVNDKKPEVKQYEFKAPISNLETTLKEYKPIDTKRDSLNKEYSPPKLDNKLFSKIEEKKEDKKYIPKDILK